VLVALCALVMVGACGTAGPATPAVPMTDGAPRPAAARGPGAATPGLAAPAGVRLDAIDVDARIVPVGVDGPQMEVPRDVTTVGWYRFGPGPGSDRGSSVLAGHVDDRVQGRGAFYRLADTRPGDPVQVDLDDGRRVEYRVSRVERVDKARLPVDALFDRRGGPRLTLVTCGGEFDEQARSYRDNVVVVAVPAGR
jgi:LPXTG-site transpeptidase (sortase) family protein